MRSARTIASAMSCVTSRTVLRKTGLDPAELVLQLPARHRVERAEGLVHQQHRWIRDKRARDADALPLSARQLVGLPIGVIGAGREPDQVEQLARRSAHPERCPSVRGAEPRRCCPRP